MSLNWYLPLVALATSAVVSAADDAVSFDRLINRGHQAASWAALDAAGLTDSVLQTIDAEHRLGRPDPTLPAATVFDLALKLATEQHDQTSLDRLSRAAEATGRDDLMARIRVSRKMAGGSRTLKPPTVVREQDLDALTLALHRTFLHDLRTARLSGDARQIGEIAEELDKIPHFPEPLIESLRFEVTQAQQEVTEQSATADAMGKLMSQSRGIKWQWQGVNSHFRVEEDNDTSGFHHVEGIPSRPNKTNVGKQLGTYTDGTLANSGRSNHGLKNGQQLGRQGPEGTPVRSRPSSRPSSQSPSNSWSSRQHLLRQYQNRPTPRTIRR